MSKQGVLRKNNCIVNTGDKLTNDERKERMKANQKLFGLTPEQIAATKKPKKYKWANFLDLAEIEALGKGHSSLDKLLHLNSLRKEIDRRICACGQEPSESEVAGSPQPAEIQIEEDSTSLTEFRYKQRIKPAALMQLSNQFQPIPQPSSVETKPKWLGEDLPDTVN